MNLSQSVAAYVSMMIAYRGLNEVAISKLVGVSRTTVSNLLGEKANLELKTVETVAANLGMNPAALLSYPQDKNMLKLLRDFPKMLEMLLALSVDKRLQAAVLLNELVHFWDKHMPERRPY